MTDLPQPLTPLSLLIVPISLAEANAFVKEFHGHHGPVAGHKFRVAVADPAHLLSDDGSLAIRGVAIVGHPVARGNDDG